MWSFWEAHNYQLLDIRGRMIADCDQFSESARLQEIWNYIGIPRENLKQVSMLSKALNQLYQALNPFQAKYSYQSEVSFQSKVPETIVFESPHDLFYLTLGINNLSDFASRLSGFNYHSHSWLGSWASIKLSGVSVSS
jgi:hypothetical protein